MAKQEIPFEIIIRGTAEAYVPEEVQDDLNTYLKEAIEYALDSRKPSKITYSIKAGESEVPFHGYSEDDIIERIAKLLYEQQAPFISLAEKTCDALKMILQERDSATRFPLLGIKISSDDVNYKELKSRLDTLEAVTAIHKTSENFESAPERIKNCHSMVAGRIFKESFGDSPHHQGFYIERK